MPFPTVAGSNLLCLDAGVQEVQVQLTSGPLARIDYVRFLYQQTPVESKTWGSIKNMFR